jgi:hypothetical protein
MVTEGDDTRIMDNLKADSPRRTKHASDGSCSGGSCKQAKACQQNLRLLQGHPKGVALRVVSRLR